jgi:hypothetical protein
MLGWDQYGLDKKRPGTPCTEVVFLHLLGYAGHVVHSGASEAQNGDAIFFMLWTRYTELVFLNTVGSVGHVVPSIVTRAQNINALFSYPCWLGAAA